VIRLYSVYSMSIESNGKFRYRSNLRFMTFHCESNWIMWHIYQLFAMSYYNRYTDSVWKIIPGWLPSLAYPSFLIIPVIGNIHINPDRNSHSGKSVPSEFWLTLELKWANIFGHTRIIVDYSYAPYILVKHLFKNKQTNYF
jgi:hypothetical protein